MKLTLLITALSALLAIAACSNNPSDQGGDARVETSGEQIFIVDQTGKKWDVTHAVKKYGFVAEDFQFGLGPFAIRPIQNPEMLSPGDPGYPDARDTFLVMGTVLNGEARAYPISVMSFHEVVDEQFGDQIVAVAY